MDYSKYSDMFSIEKSRLLYLIDRVKMCDKTSCTQFTDFLTPEEVVVLTSICIDKGFKISTSGGSYDCERVIAAIYNYDLIEEYPIEVIKINGNFKFEKITHRDYLGAILSLGVKREKIGDINVFEDGAEIYVHNDIASYIELNLNKIKHSGIKTQIISCDDVREKIQEFKEMKVIVTSMRLDCITAALLNISRAKSVEIIKNGIVKVNHIFRIDIDFKINEADLISIKGYGRYKISEILGKTKSDRQTLVVKKYV